MVPARMASTPLGGAAGLRRRASTVMATDVATMAAPPAASTLEIAESKPVSRLKCEGTWRQACAVTSTTSSTQAATKIPTTSRRIRGEATRNELSATNAITVSPNATPKVTALRQETGPSHGPPARA